MKRLPNEIAKLWKTEDYRAVWLGLGILFLALVAFSTGGTIGAAVIVPLGCLLSIVVFSTFRPNIGSLM